MGRSHTGFSCAPSTSRTDLRPAGRASDDAAWRNRRVLDLFGIELPIIQAPMSGHNGSALIG
jgi:hypothetical protein